jgi:hypothetical protein
VHFWSASTKKTSKVLPPPWQPSPQPWPTIMDSDDGPSTRDREEPGSCQSSQQANKSEQWQGWKIPQLASTSY